MVNRRPRKTNDLKTMKTLLRNMTILALAAAPFVTGCSDDGNQINYRIQTGDRLYLPKSNTAYDLSLGMDIRFEWSPSVAEDNGFVSYELLFDRADGDFSQPLAALTSQLTGSQTYLSVPAKELNTVARAAGIGSHQTGDIRWTVRASKGINGSLYAESRLLTVTTMNSMSPLPKTVTLTGEAVEDPTAGIRMVASAGIDNVPATEGTFECFTRIKGGTDFTVTDDLGRYYALNGDGTITDSETPVANRLAADAIYWIRADFGVMTWEYDTVSGIEYYAASYVDNKMSTVKLEMTYAGKGVWELLNYENTISDNSANDSRHRFNATLGDGSKLYLGTRSSLGSEYTTAYWKVNLFTDETIGNVDWDKTYSFLPGDCGRKLDCYLYLNGDNPAGCWWHEYKFK